MRENDTAELLKNRDESGIDSLIRHYGPLMRYIIAPILQNPHDTEECFSEAVMKVWDNINKYDPGKGGWTPWLTAVTRNCALNFLKSSASPPLGEIPDTAPSEYPTPEETVLREERSKELKRAIDTLSRQERLIFYRKYYYLQPTARIASELGLSERAVEGRLYRLKAKLRKALGGEYSDR